MVTFGCAIRTEKEFLGTEAGKKRGWSDTCSPLPCEKKIAPPIPATLLYYSTLLKQYFLCLPAFSRPPRHTFVFHQLRKESFRTLHLCLRKGKKVSSS